MKKYDNFNFFKHTYCEFEKVGIDFFKQKSTHYQSKSGSLYFYTKKGVYRFSNHWGRVANCRWKISGVEAYKAQNYYVGYANWNAFVALSSTEKMFYLKVDYATGKTKIIREIEGNSTSNFLMTLDFANKRLKQLKGLFKNKKWATYYNKNVDIVQHKLIERLINSDKSLQVLKLELKNSYSI